MSSLNYQLFVFKNNSLHLTLNVSRERFIQFTFFKFEMQLSLFTSKFLPTFSLDESNIKTNFEL